MMRYVLKLVDSQRGYVEVALEEKRNEVIARFIDRAREHLHSNGPIYHYTNLEALLSIFQNEHFWVSHMDFLNDPLEGRHIHDIIDSIANVIEENYSSVFPELANFVRLTKPEVSFFGSEIYVFSCSTNPNSINLWSNYSESNGCNIELPSVEVLKAPNTYNLFGKVIYDKKNQASIIVDEIIDLWTNFRETDDEEEQTFYIRSARNAVYIYSLFFKDEFFRDESEYRVIFIVLPDSTIQTKFRFNHGTFIPYIELPLPNVSRITIDPRNNNDLTEQGLKYFLEKKYPEVSLAKPPIKWRF